MEVNVQRKQINPNLYGITKPTIDEIYREKVVIIDGYKLATTMMAFYVYYDFMNEAYPALHPCYAEYWTNSYRWLIRYLSLVPDWIYGRHDNYVDTHRVWRKRFFFMDWWVPKWVRPLFFCVPPESWAWEKFTWRRWSRYSEPQFGKYYFYPSKKFTYFESMKKGSTVENMDMTDASVQ
ncbi:hypothetical protein HF086_003324 [Spodoptera exigua]|uniref:Uncharacterized protein n=1 Tax=Spodoptera exigua TaxID=7107 RepID=A0A922MY61_SPOEX|nr:hypothetical protein HF086_003324 [Spodoptera exigua]